MTRVFLNVGDGGASKAFVSLDRGADGVLGMTTVGTANKGFGQAREDGAAVKNIWLGNTSRVEPIENNPYKQSTELKTAVGTGLKANDLESLLESVLGVGDGFSAQKYINRGIDNSDGIDGVTYTINGDDSVTLHFDGVARGGKTDDLTVTGAVVEDLIDMYVNNLVVTANGSSDIRTNARNDKDQTVITTLGDLYADQHHTLILGSNQFTINDGENTNKFGAINAKTVLQDALGADIARGDDKIDSLEDFDQITKIDNGEGTTAYMFGGWKGTTNTIIVEDDSNDFINPNNRSDQFVFVSEDAGAKELVGIGNASNDYAGVAAPLNAGSIDDLIAVIETGTADDHLSVKNLGSLKVVEVDGWDGSTDTIIIDSAHDLLV